MLDMVKVPPFCDDHQRELVRKARYKESDTWRALLIVSNIAMFQGAAATPSVHKKLEGVIENIDKLGCLACRLPHKYQQLLSVVTKKHDLGDIKRLGERWVKEAANE